MSEIRRVNGYVLLDVLPQVEEGVKRGFRWSSNVAEALSGLESAASFYQRGMRSISFSQFAMDAAESAYLDKLFRAALVEARCAIPQWGRYRLSTDVSVDLATVFVDHGGRYQIGETLAFSDGTTVHLRAVAAVAAGQITLDAPLPDSFEAGDEVYQILYGRISCQQADGRA